MPLKPDQESRLDSWLEWLKTENAVVHYDPETKEGFFYIPRQAGDKDLIHEPKSKTTTRKRVD